jgi:predicted NAD/FAD-binding protein
MRIAIIGAGGAGMTAAWLLDPAHQIVLLERNAKLGGHAHTIEIDRDGRTHHVDDGFSWFRPDIYPCFMRLLEAIDAAWLDVPMTASFFDTRDGFTVTMPPRGIQGFLRLALHPRVLRTLTQLDRTISAARSIVLKRDTDVCVRDFLAGMRLNKRYEREFLVPFMSAVWGGPFDRTDDFAVYPIMKYMVLDRCQGLATKTWHVVDGGCNSYIRRVAGSLGATAVHRRARARSLQRDAAGIVVHDDTGQSHHVDHVVMACGARDARSILEASPGFEAGRDAVQAFSYYQAQVATHSDPEYMPRNRRDWRVVNARYSGGAADMSTWDGWRSGTDVFRSYIQPGEEPRDLHHVSTFWLPFVTPDHFRAQSRLQRVQGDHGLWFAGDYTQDIGGHEEAVRSAIDVVRRIDPSAARLRVLSEEKAIAAE